ncbi:MAG: hypothetical protein RIA09_15790 [Hoeflea sp.]|jgi:hypothetical protein|uniref:phage tail fiber protein n=1 Tax=Hoeflea sp. TaxID=1940281 RepID=UPI0032EBE554
MNLSTYLQNLIAQWTRGTDFPAAPSSVQIGLSSTDPLVDGSGILEPLGANGYSRQTVNFFPASSSVNFGSEIRNADPISFGPVTNATWSGVQYVFLVDDSDNLLMFGPMNTARSLPVGDTFVLAMNAVQLKLDLTFGRDFSFNILRWISGTAMPSAPTSLKLALSTTDPLSDLSAIDEPSTGDGYARQTMEFAAPTVVPGEGTVMEMAQPLIFGPAVINPWDQLTHGAILDQDDNPIFFGELASPRTVAIGDALPVATPTIKLLIR